MWACRVVVAVEWASLLANKEDRMCGYLLNTSLSFNSASQHSGNCPNPSSTQEPKQQQEPIAWDGKAASELS